MQITVHAAGPFFSLGSGPIRDAIHDTVRELVAEGESQVKEQLYPGHGLITGHYRRSIHGEVLGSMNGTVHDSNVVYGPWLEGVSSRNDRTRFKGYAMFRRTFQQLGRMADGLLKKHIGRALGKLN